MANHEVYVVQGKTLDNIAGTMRAVLGVDKDAPIRFDEVATSDKTEQINTDVETQTDLIAQIKTALEGKAAGSGSEIIAGIGALIDKSGVLGTTDETVTVTDKVKALIKKAEDESLWYNQIKTSGLRGIDGYCNLFENYGGTRLPRVDVSNFESMYRFCYSARNLERIDYYLDSGKVDKQYRAAFENTVNLTYIKGLNTSVTYDVRDLFNNSGIETIEMPLNFSNVKQSANAFRCYKLKDISFYPETIPVSLTFMSAVLTIGNVFNLNDTENVGSVQSIINGLITLAEGAAAQTLTLSKNLPLTEEQKQAITTAVNNKGWTLAFA